MLIADTGGLNYTNFGQFLIGRDASLFEGALMAQYASVRSRVSQRVATRLSDSPSQKSPEQLALLASYVRSVVDSIAAQGSASDWIPAAYTVALGIVRIVLFQCMQEVPSAMSSAALAVHLHRVHRVFKAQVFRHSIDRPPASAAIFSVTAAQALHDIVLDVVFRDLKMLVYALTRDHTRIAGVKVRASAKEDGSSTIDQYV
jgi:hypothetical protein